MHSPYVKNKEMKNAIQLQMNNTVPGSTLRMDEIPDALVVQISNGHDNDELAQNETLTKGEDVIPTIAA